MKSFCKTAREKLVHCGIEYRARSHRDCQVARPCVNDRHIRTDGVITYFSGMELSSSVRLFFIYCTYTIVALKSGPARTVTLLEAVWHPAFNENKNKNKN